MSDQNPDQDQVENEASPELATEDASVADAQDAPEGEQPADEMSLLQEQLEAAEAAAGMARDELLRVQAEMQNLRRRTEQDIEKAHKYGQEKFSIELLAVMDNLERAAAASEASEDEAVKAIQEGVALTLERFRRLLRTLQYRSGRPSGRALRSSAASGYVDSREPRCRAQYGDRGDAKRLHPARPRYSSGYGDGVEITPRAP